jgi:putative IMPACT (imprinted ancient) family translation regulator
VTADPSDDARRVPAREGRGEVREKASRFLGVAAPAESARDAEAFVARLARDYHDATHVAFAFKIGSGAAATARSSDAGEPSGTAGRPIAGAIAAAGLSGVVVAVVRYYGGTKLGTGGLARAYREAAERALADAGTKTVYDTVRIETRPSHARAGVVRRLIDPPNVRLAAERFDPDPVLELEVRRSLLAALQQKLRDERIAFRIAGATS